MNNQCKEKVYISVDIEATGNSPVTSSCVMIGCVVFRIIDDITTETLGNDWIIDKRRWCIREIVGCPMNECCKTEFWSKHDDVWKYIQENALEPKFAMLSFTNWFVDLSKKYDIVFCARPMSYDWQWINCLYDEFGPADKPRLPFSGYCISTLIKTFDMLCPKWDDIIKPQLNIERFKMSHYADDDALYQAYMFVKTISWLKKNVTIKI